MEKIFFDQTIKYVRKTKDNIRKSTTGQGDDYTTGCFLDYNCFEKRYKMIAMDLTKQQTLNSDRKAIQQINFTGNLRGASNRETLFVIEEANKTIIDFSRGTVKV